jgi:hypothetical protein
MLNLSAIAHGSSSCESQPCNYVLKLCWNLLESMLSKKNDHIHAIFMSPHQQTSTPMYTHADSGSCRSCVIFRVMSPHVLIVAVPQCLGRFDANINTYQYYLAMWSIWYACLVPRVTKLQLPNSEGLASCQSWPIKRGLVWLCSRS